MGWLWASPSPPKPSSPANNTSTNDSSSSSSASTSVAPNEPVDPEIQKFFDLFKQESSTSTAKSDSPVDTTAKPKDNSSSSSSWFSSQSLGSPSSSSTWSRDASRLNETPAPPQLDPLSETLLPTDMSCRQAFDLAWSCSSVGGQWNAVYRYGGMRSCSEHWDDFWFCMRTKSYTGEMRQNLIKQHYREKAWRKYGNGQPSSEDIWESRQHMVPEGSVFSEDINAALGSATQPQD